MLPNQVIEFYTRFARSRITRGFYTLPNQVIEFVRVHCTHMRCRAIQLHKIRQVKDHSRLLYATNNSANFYIWSHSADFVDALQHGRSLGSRRYYGNEQLQLNFYSATTTTLQLEIYSYVENVLDQSTHSIKKISM